MGRGGFQRVDLAANDIHLTAANDHIAIGELHLAFTCGFDFPAFQDHSRLETFFEKVVEGRFFVVGNTGRSVGFGGHKGVMRERRGLYNRHNRQLGRAPIL